MIIQCEQCSTKFRLDDSKVTAKGVKVRCAKCRHVFSVRKEAPAEGEGTDFGSLLDRAETPAAAAPPPPSAPTAATAGFMAAGLAESAPMQEETVQQDPDRENNWQPSEPAAEDYDFGAPALDAGNTAPTPPQEESAVFSGSNEFDFGSFDFKDNDQTKPSTEVTTPSQPDRATDLENGFDFSSFDFSDDGTTASLDAVPPREQEPSVVPDDTMSAGDDAGMDFGSDNLFGDAPASPQAEETGSPISFDFQESFADSIGSPERDQPASDAAPTPDEPFSLGEIDFGDELTAVAVQQVNPEELKPGQDLLFAPLGAERSSATPEEAAPPTPPGAPAAAEEELPPLPISSRRKQGPLLSIVSAAVGIAAAAAIGFYGYTSLKNSGSGAQETGKISLRSISATYVSNQTSGELLVISGEAVNDYKKPRASIQVRGMIYGSDGKVLASRNAYGGNPLTPEQLATMPLEKLEAAMANQFGDSLANLEVAPGKAIPFVVVIPQPPSGGKEYGVEPAGSTVATGKQ